MKDAELKSILSGCDEGIVPDNSLADRTAQLMNTALSRRPKRTPFRTLLLAAAVALSMLLMVGAGYKVFEYVYFLPGKGIVMDDGSVVISVLERAVQYENMLYIEACSLEKNEDGTNTLTLITNNPYAIQGKGSLGSSVEAEADGESYTLELKKASSGICYYVCCDFPDVSGFRIGDAEIKLTPINAAKFSTIKFPTKHGITFIAFPLSEGSSMIAYTVQYIPEDDGTVLPKLAELSQVVSADLRHEFYLPAGNFTVTDIHGGTYYEIGSSASWLGEKSDSQGYLNGEHIIELDRRLEADIASISVDTLAIEFFRPKIMDAHELTVPEYGETIDYNETFIDKYGFYDAPKSISFIGTDTADVLTLHFDKAAKCDIDYVSRAVPIYAMYTEDEKQSELYNSRVFTGAGLRTVSDTSINVYERNFVKTVLYPTSVFASGDTIYIELYSLILDIQGNWTINFN